MTHRSFQPIHRAFVKHILVLLTIILALIPAVFAEDDKWIDGIKLRTGETIVDTSFYIPGGSRVSDTLMEVSTSKRISPITIAFPETMMNSWSYRGVRFDFQTPTESKDIPPWYYYTLGESGPKTQSPEQRLWLYNDFFNDSDRDFADSNPNWAMSADMTISNIFLGYSWGAFIPGRYSLRFLFGLPTLGLTELLDIMPNLNWPNTRLLKVSLGFGISITNLSYKLNLCSQYINEKCFGKKEIDSASGNLIPGFSAPTGDVTFWERITEDTSWKIFKATTFRSPDGKANYLKLKNHDKNFEVYLFSKSIEYISFTYRF